MTIGEHHNYAVGHDSILVHNESLCAAGEAWLEQLIQSGKHADNQDNQVAYFLRKSGFDNAEGVISRIASNALSKGDMYEDAILYAFRNKVIEFGEKFVDRFGRAGEIDFETAESLFEVGISLGGKASTVQTDRPSK